MSYITINDLNIRFGTDIMLGLTDRDGDGVADVEFVTATLSQVGGFINGYLASNGYDVAFGLATPEILKSIACDIAFYRLQYGETSPASDARYKEAVRLLERISEGKLKLDLPKKMEDASITKNASIEDAVVVETGRTDWKQRR